MAGKKTGEIITKDMTISEVVSRWPETAEIMMGNGLHCIGCHISPYESIEAGCLGHGMSNETIENMVSEMNATIKGNGAVKDVALSDSAAKKFSELMKEEGKTGYGIRLSIEPEGCSDQSYLMDFTEKPDADDAVLEDKGLRVFVKKDLLAIAKGTRIDYIEGTGGGFRISGQNVRKAGKC